MGQAAYPAQHHCLLTKGMYLASEPSQHSEGLAVLGSHLLTELEQTESALSLYPSQDSAEASCSR